MKRVISSVLFLIFIITIFSDPIETNGAPNPANPRPPSINIVLYDYDIEIETGPVRSGHEEVIGNITVVRPSEARMDTVFIELYLNKRAEELDIIMTPSSFEFPGGEGHSMSIEFTLKFDVNPMKVSSYLNGFFWIEGYWYYEMYAEGGDVPGTSGEVFIIPYTRTEAALAEDRDTSMVSVGSWKEYGIVVENHGNAQIQILVEIKEPPEDIEYYIDKPKITLNQRESATSYLRIRQAEGEGRTNRIKVTFTTKLIEEKEVDSVEITLKTEGEKDSFFHEYWPLLVLIAFVLLNTAIVVFIIGKKGVKKKKMKKNKV